MSLKKEPWYNVTSKFIGMTIGIISLAGMAVSAILFISGLFELPQAFVAQAKQIESIRSEVSNLTVAFNSSRPEVVSTVGVGIVASETVVAGRDLVIVYTLRGNITCDTDILVRFWDHSRNLIVNSYSYTMETNKAPVTTKHIHFPITLLIPKELPEGTYSYAPLLIPRDCGIYPEQVLPLSEKFEVKKGNNYGYTDSNTTGG